MPEEPVAHKYHNPDPRCGYIADGMSYCWSYAHHVDGTEGYEDMIPICERCELWQWGKVNPSGHLGELLELGKEVSNIADNGYLPDGDHVSNSTAMWAERWRGRLGSMEKEAGRAGSGESEAVPVLMGLVAGAYRALHRGQWEEGESDAELCERINETMINHFGEGWCDVHNQQ